MSKPTIAALSHHGTLAWTRKFRDIENPTCGKGVVLNEETRHCATKENSHQSILDGFENRQPTTKRPPVVLTIGEHHFSSAMNSKRRNYDWNVFLRVGKEYSALSFTYDATCKRGEGVWGRDYYFIRHQFIPEWFASDCLTSERHRLPAAQTALPNLRGSSRSGTAACSVAMKYE